MADTAKLFSTEDGQAVRLPEEFRFDGDEVRIHREGHRVVLEPSRISDDAIDEETGLTIGKLRALIQEGIDSGPAGPLDIEEMKREARARRAARLNG